MGKSATSRPRKKIYIRVSFRVLEAAVWVRFGEEKNGWVSSVPTAEEGSGCGWSRTADGP